MAADRVTTLREQIKILPPSDVPEPFKAGLTFDTVSVNPAEYLPWLQSELISRGVTFERRSVGSLDELRSVVGTDGILVNATSLGKCFLFVVTVVIIGPKVPSQSSEWKTRNYTPFVDSRSWYMRRACRRAC